MPEFFIVADLRPEPAAGRVASRNSENCDAPIFSFCSPSDIVWSMSPKPQDYDFASQLLASKDFFNRSTRVLEEADSGFRPQEGMMTVAQQVAHAAQTLDWFIEGASRPEGFDLDFAKHAEALDQVTSLSAARQMLETAYANAIHFLRSRSPEDLAQPLPPGPVMGGQPITDIVWAMVEHTAHHRGALTVYSRQLGKVSPMPYGG
ncbi:MAG TPA: DinB family protein [Bryobacteraceae bacterium]